MIASIQNARLLWYPCASAACRICSFIPFGMKGRKLVSDFLTDIKISPAERKNRLVVSFNKDIIWVLGYRSDNRYRVTAQTATQLVLSLI